MPEIILHIMKVNSSESIDLSVDLDADMSVIRKKIATKENADPSRIIIICTGTTLKDGTTVHQYDLGDRSNIRYLVKGAPKVVQKPNSSGNIELIFNFYEGHNYSFNVPLHYTWAEVKKLLEAKSHTPSSELRLIHAQQELLDDVHVIQSNVMDASRIFCVLKPNSSSHLDKILNENNLKCTCCFCETQGATISVRPYCNTCKGECILFDHPEQFKLGSTTWKNLLHITGKCINENCKAYDQSTRCAFYAHCTSCPVNIRIQRHKLIDIPSNSTEETLLEQLNKLYSYAHMNGALE